MKQLKLYILLLIGTVLFACNDHVLTDLEQSQNSNSPYNKNLETAIAMAENMIKSIEVNQTRSVNRTIRSISPINGTTRSDDSSQWYIVNYDNEAGFCIVTDADIPSPVAAFSEQGELVPYSIDLGSPLSIYLNALNYYGVDFFNINSESFDVPGDPEAYIPTGGIGGGIDGGTRGGFIPNPGGFEPIPDPGIVTPQTIYVTKPLIAEPVQKWGQSDPFNRYCPRQWNESTQSYEHGLAGCAAVACGMIMSYYEWPGYYTDHRFNWDYINNNEVNYEHGFVPLLLYDLGKPENLNITYGLAGSSASINNFSRTFFNFEYYNTVWHDFSEQKLSSFLHDKHPVIVTGSGYDYINKKDVCHAWVIDGYYILKYNDCADPDPNSPKQANYYHNIWGWNAGGNGYYRMPNKDITVEYNNNGIQVNQHYYKNLKIMSGFAKREQ